MMLDHISGSPRFGRVVGSYRAGGPPAVDVHRHVQLPGGGAMLAGAAEFTEPNPLAFPDAGRDADLVDALLMDDLALP
ncbi:hypothetical protein [Streptomyces sp. NPDC059788]|uniref:hypothetical protein n=1 Tax=Streptomyces sp. NPDC059788 TaxID=3346948 RepID=UPI00365C56A6